MIPVTLPQLSLAMEQGKITRWLVADGDHVSRGQVIVEIETDKAMTELEAPAGGTIRLVAHAGEFVAVDSTVAEIVDGDPAATLPAAERGPLASPAARRLAKERGIDLSRIVGSGPGGRITVLDLDTMQTTTSEGSHPLRDAVVAEIAASWRQIPHIHIGGELNGSGLVAAKRAAPAGVTITDLLVLAIVKALREVPELNGARGETSENVHIAIAVATASGVISPVLRNAHRLSLTAIAQERGRLVTAARAGTADPRTLSGATITLSNLGAYPVDFFAPIISGPQIAMVATGRLAARPVVFDEIVTVEHRIWTNVAIDHRVADGADGARFLAALERSFNELG